VAGVSDLHLKPARQALPIAGASDRTAPTENDCRFAVPATRPAATTPRGFPATAGNRLSPKIYQILTEIFRSFHSTGIEAGKNSCSCASMGDDLWDQLNQPSEISAREKGRAPQSTPTCQDPPSSAKKIPRKSAAAEVFHGCPYAPYARDYGLPLRLAYPRDPRGSASSAIQGKPEARVCRVRSPISSREAPRSAPVAGVGAARFQQGGRQRGTRAPAAANRVRPVVIHLITDAPS
jgi:hypothetical protein